MKLNFKDYLLNEHHAKLGRKLGDILNSLHDLSDNAKNLGTRLLVQRSQVIVNNIRRVLNDPWPKEEEAGLKALQKVAFGILKAIDEKGDLEGVLVSGAELLGQASHKNGTPVNNLASDTNNTQGDAGEAPSPPDAPPQPPGAAAGSQPGQMPGPGGQPGMPPGAPPGPPAFPPTA